MLNVSVYGRLVVADQIPHRIVLQRLKLRFGHRWPQPQKYTVVPSLCAGIAVDVAYTPFARKRHWNSIGICTCYRTPLYLST